MDLSHRTLLLLGLGLLFQFGYGQVTDTPETTKAPVKTVTCYACGLEEISPEGDVSGTYCNADKVGEKECYGKKMYNHTCDIMDRSTDKELWKRKCPEGVKSCYFSEGKYAGQKAVFRGCASAKYPHKNECQRELRAIPLATGKRSVEVEILLCYCNEDNCNDQGSSSNTISAFTALIAFGCFASFILDHQRF